MNVCYNVLRLSVCSTESRLVFHTMSWPFPDSPLKNAGTAAYSSRGFAYNIRLPILIHALVRVLTRNSSRIQGLLVLSRPSLTLGDPNQAKEG